MFGGEKVAGTKSINRAVFACYHLVHHQFALLKYSTNCLLRIPRFIMKVFNIILVAALAAFANAAAVANPEAAVDSAPLEKRCRASRFHYVSGSAGL